MTNEFYYRSAKNLGQNLFCCPCSALVTDLTGNFLLVNRFQTDKERVSCKSAEIAYIFIYFTCQTGQEVASYWYSTFRRYNFFKDIRLLHTNVNAGHFTQIVWVNTKYFGIGKSMSKAGKIFVVAYYYPPG